MFAFVLVETGNDTSLGSAFVIIIAMVLQFAVFIFSLVIIYKLWSILINAIKGSNNATAKVLANLLGGFSAKGENKTPSIIAKMKIGGFGLLGTIVILVLACIAMYVIGHHSAGITRP